MGSKVLNCCAIVHILLSFIPLCMTAHLQDFKVNKVVEKTTKKMELHPDQIHLSMGKMSNDIIVMWATSFDDESIVEYHTGDKAQLKEKKGETVQFTSNTQGRQYLHRVELSDLKPGTKYYYAVRGKTEKLISDQYSFVVPGKYNAQTYMIYGDMGTQTTNIQFIIHEAILEDKKHTYEAIFHIGDIAYDLGKLGGTVGDKFLNTIQKMAARFPYMTVPGDHDLFQKDQYRYRFSMPGSDWPMKSDELWYSIDVGFVHFVGISTEIFFGGMDNVSNSENIQSFMKWLQNDLQKANENRRRYPWVIVMGHRPLYCSVDDKNEDCTKEDSVVRNKLENMFYSYGVDLYISGHNHIYERTYPVYKGKALSLNYLDPKATVQIIIGNMGNQYLSEFSTKPGGAWSAKTISDIDKEMYVRLTVYNATHLYWEALNARDNSVLDKVLIVQRLHGAFSKKMVYIPDPLQGVEGLEQPNSDKNTFNIINFKFLYIYDDYHSRITVLTFTLIILVIGIIMRKKVLNFFRICCLKHEVCTGPNGQK